MGGSLQVATLTEELFDLTQTFICKFVKIKSSKILNWYRPEYTIKFTQLSNSIIL